MSIQTDFNRIGRFSIGLAVMGAGIFAASFSARANTPERYAKTAAFVAGLQNRDGGFAARPGEPSTLGATSSALRSLRHIGGSVRNVSGAIEYVKSCRDAATGGFAPKPGGAADVRSTAVGLMAAVELLIADESLRKGVMDYLDKHVKTFEDVRIAVAGLESAKQVSPRFADWIAIVESGRNASGTFGSGANEARATGGSVVALLRMGKTPADTSVVLAAMRSGQRRDGGWGSAEDGASDLETTYRVMRAFYMLNEAPNIDALRGFVDSLEGENGGYAVKKGAPVDQAGTYFATIILRWARELVGEPALVETAGFTSLVAGDDLTGWEGDSTIWKAINGSIVGKTLKLDHNDFLASRTTYGDFILKATFRLKDGAGNSGIMFRARRQGAHEMSGYQADIGENYWGSLYDESRRNKTLVAAAEPALKKLHKNLWNQYLIRAIGDDVRLSLNGVESVHYVEKDGAIARSGALGLQVHAGGPTEVEFKDLYIQKLPTPTADRSNAPGFHVRTHKFANEERKYVVYVPEGYDATVPVPVVLFLHGSGERGSDGIVPSQVGLGPAIAARPSAFPFLAVFPQARRTWAADSDDARAALAALDDVEAYYVVDPRRVVLTGLSMGGRGAWEIASAHPERFAAVVPVCGMGKPEDAGKLKDLAVWGFVGDADRAQTVLNLRSMIAALRSNSSGAEVRVTEYRGVGHNSWDRAYGDPELIRFMLAQRRPKH
jgi:dienelactone hydrolase